MRMGRESNVSFTGSCWASHTESNTHTPRCGRDGSRKQRGMRGGRETWCNFWGRRWKATREWVVKWEGRSCNVTLLIDTICHRSRSPREGSLSIVVELFLAIPCELRNHVFLILLSCAQARSRHSQYGITIALPTHNARQLGLWMMRCSKPAVAS